MSAGLQSATGTSPRPDVLGELLHSLSQPLTSLRCSLELSIDGAAERQHESVSFALQQTEKVIGMVELMREYLDAQQPLLRSYSTPIAPVLKTLIEDLSSAAEVRGVTVRFVGNSTATLPVPRVQLRLALQYLMAALIEAQPSPSHVGVLLGQGPAGTVLRAEVERSHPNESASSALQPQAPPVPESLSTLRRARLAIARRVLEGSGASLLIDDGTPFGFALRIPRPEDGVL
jgi:hypothetical protein